jgi:ribosome biogenesis GTPase
MALQANYCLVACEETTAGTGPLLCTRRSRLGKSGLDVHVGDRVAVEAIDAAGRGVVTAVAERRNLLRRPAVANVSRVVVVVSLAEPTPEPLQLTRFLVSAETVGVPVLLVFTKADLISPAEARSWCERARDWGYDPEAVSVRARRGVARLQARLGDPGITVLCGPSGVGKSSLLNALRPGLDLRVGAVSGRLRRGRHTTRHVELFSLAAGSLVADTPGFNRPELPADPVMLAQAFPEVRQRLAIGSCRFRDCRHRGDPGCAVGTDWERHPLYDRCLQDLLQDTRATGGTGPEGTSAGLRQRGGRWEPRLDPRLRAGSRRRQRQRLEEELSPPCPADSDPAPP